MNQVNPLHIGALLLAIIAYLLFTLSSIKSELVEEQDAYVISEKVALELRGLKDVYGDTKRSESALSRLLAQPSIKSANLDVKKSKKSWKISTKSIDVKALDSLMGKILNGTYNIKELRIERLSETKASLMMEIVW